jgi:hypothetical protein
MVFLPLHIVLVCLELKHIVRLTSNCLIELDMKHFGLTTAAGQNIYNTHDTQHNSRASYFLPKVSFEGNTDLDVS